MSTPQEVCARWARFAMSDPHLADLLSLPLYWLQGNWVRLRTPRLAPAPGDESGFCGDCEPVFKLLVFGESTAAGIGASCQESALAGQLAVALRTFVNRAVAWRAIGASGLTVEAARRALLPRVGADPVDCAVLVFGVNDVLQGTPDHLWVEHWTALIAELRARIGPVPIYLAGVPPLQIFPALPEPLRAWLGRRAARLERALQQLCRELKQVHYCEHHVDTTAGMFCADRFHPSDAGYRVWAQQLAQRIIAREGLA